MSKIKCSGQCCMCFNAKNHVNPCDAKGILDAYTVAGPDELILRLDSMNIPNNSRIEIIKYLRDNYDIAYRPSLVYVSTMALIHPSVNLPPIIHKVLYKGRESYLINNDFEILSNLKDINLELDYEEITNASVVHVLFQSWKSHLVNLSNKWEIELIVNDKVNNTMGLVQDMVDDVLDAYIELMADYLDDKGNEIVNKE